MSVDEKAARALAIKAWLLALRQAAEEAAARDAAAKAADDKQEVA